MIYLDKEELDIRKIAESGQTFRMKQTGDKWLLCSADRIAFAKENEDSLAIESDDAAFWCDYFDMQTDYKAIRESIDPEDLYLTEAADFSKGIRILRQDLFEMLISFIISQRKSIPAISSSIEKICGGFDKPFPSCSELAEFSEAKLASCGLGYRVPYIMKAASDAAEGSLDLEKLSELSDEDLVKELMKIYGVGIKVANCVALFGYHRISAFPVDVWIKRVLDEYYPQGFPFESYKGYAGVLQQYMFYYARK